MSWLSVNENIRQRGIDPMPNLDERPRFKSDVRMFDATPSVDRPYVIRASFVSACARCGGWIAKGDPIESCFDGWVHIECGDYSDDDVDEFNVFMHNAGDR